MLNISNSRAEKLYSQWIKITAYEKRIKLVDIDFDKPWWYIFTKVKGLLIGLVSVEVVVVVARTLTPILLGLAVDQRNMGYFAAAGIIVISTRIIEYIASYFHPMLDYTLEYSIYNSASKFFLKTDPKNHATKSSGQILSKIARGANGSGVVIEVVTDLLDFVIRLLTFIISLFWIQKIYAFSTLIVVLILVIISYILYSTRKRWFVDIKFIVDDDTVKVRLENLTQAVFIRSVFATYEQVKKQTQKHLKNLIFDAAYKRLSNSFGTFNTIVFDIYVLWFGYSIITNSDLGAGVIISLLSILIGFSGQLRNIGKVINNYYTNMAGLEDLFKFIQNFGQPSYPVISGKNTEIKSNNLD